MLVDSVCKLLKATLAGVSTDASIAQDALVQQQQAATALLQQCVKVLDLAPDDLFGDLAQRVEGNISGHYSHRVDDDYHRAILAEASQQASVIASMA